MIRARRTWGRGWAPLAGAIVVVAVALVMPLGVPGAGAEPGMVPSISPLDEEPEVVAALERLETAQTEFESADAAAEAAAGAIDGAESTAATTAATLDELDRQVDELGGRVDAAFERHAENRRSYVDAAVAAYVAGVPDSMQLRAALLEDPTERSHSLALAQTVGDVFSERAARYRASGESLDGDLRVLAEDRAAARRAADEAAGALEQARATVEVTATARRDAEEELDAAEEGVEVARLEARRRIEEAAERFRLGEIDRDELTRLADDRVAVFDIPVRAYDAYVTAARAVDAEQPACRISWWALAAVGRIESGHGRHGGAVILPNGDVVPRIVGPALDGGRFRAIPDTDGGRWDGDPVWDRAVGPMQFIPSTWASMGADGNGNGVADPHNYYDAATAAARYLCRGRGGQALDTADGLRAAALTYNRSGAYADQVVATARGYGGLTVPE